MSFLNEINIVTGEIKSSFVSFKHLNTLKSLYSFIYKIKKSQKFKDDN